MRTLTSLEVPIGGGLISSVWTVFGERVVDGLAVTCFGFSP